MTLKESKYRTFDILLVEDNLFDIHLAKIALEETKVPCRLQVVADGEDAMDFLHRRKPYELVPRPDVVLLDLNLPRKDGREVLQEIKADPDLRSIPVIVLTTSVAEEDILKSYDLCVNCFITKPMDVIQFGTVIKSITDFWLKVVQLPKAAP